MSGPAKPMSVHSHTPLRANDRAVHHHQDGSNQKVISTGKRRPMCTTPPVSGQIINPQCSIHVSLHQPKLCITQTPRQNSELAVTTLVPRPGRVARFIQRFAKSPQSPGTNQSRTNPHCWHSHYHCLVVWQLRVWRRCGHLQKPTMLPTLSFVQHQNINRPTLLLCSPKKPTCSCSRITIESS